MHFLSALLFPCCVVAWAAAADEPSPQPSDSAQSIARLLAMDTTPGKAGLDAIQTQYEQTLRVAPRDARLEYAYALILQRLFKPEESQRHLQRALEIDPTYLPANQVVIRESLKARRFNEAGEQLAAFAARLDPRRNDAQEAAEWLGRIINCVVLAIGTPDARSQFSYLDRMLRPALPPLLLARYEKGFNSVERDLERLTSAVEEARSMADQKREVAKAHVDADLVKDQEQIKQKQQAAQRTRQKWDEWIGDQTSKADDVLKELEKRYQELENAATVQQTAVAALRLALDRLDRQLVPAQNSIGIVSSNRPAVEVQLSLEEQRLASLFERQSAVANQAARALAARRNAVAQYQQATGIAFKQEANLDRWEKRNKTVAENMKKAAEKKPAQVAALEGRIRLLSTWDPADFESEKRRVLADLGLPAENVQPATAAP